MLARGDSGAARAALSPAQRQPESLPCAVAHARLRIADGDHRSGASALLALARDEQLAPVAWEAEAAIALARDGETGLAERVARGALARATDDRLGRAAALRASGLVASEPAALTHAATYAATGGATLLEARALFDLGALLRRRGERRAARRPLRRAAELARRCGATGLSEAVETELRASGARARRDLYTGVAALTPSELRVARLAAQRRSYRSIAAELFISVKTVETHLGRVYRKLDIAGRDQLAGVLE